MLAIDIHLHLLLEWVTQHPHWAAITVFIIALTESLVVVGLVVPGAVLMIAAGAPAYLLPGVALLALVVAGGWHVADRYSADLQRYAPRLKVQHLEAALWWQDDWRQLPAYRQDLEGEFEQPFNVQWSSTLVPLHEKLRAQGWRDPLPLNTTTDIHSVRRK